MNSNTMPPLVTVVMPVYNGARFLREAIVSILDQYFTNFEFLIIDDGSTDDSVAIVKSFSDPRIRLILNDQNIGVAQTLNKGIELAKGEFIARMDSDDISMPSRFTAQLNRFSSAPDTSVVATWVTLIDADGDEVGNWSCDRAASTFSEICRHLPKANCLAHPSIMMRRDVITKYRYRSTKVQAEDYDLWLRLAADGIRLEKIKYPLVRYRIHSNSVTTISNSSSYGTKNIFSKALFLSHRLGSRKWLGSFDLRVSGFLMLDLSQYACNKIEAYARKWFRKTLIMTGRLVSLFVLRKTLPPIFFFFPFYHIGGAERVHADIVAAVADQKPWVMITEPSKTTEIKNQFQLNSHLIEISTLAKGVVGRIICLGFFSGLINRSKGGRVFGSNTPFFYELIPYLTSKVKIIDLIHAFGGGIESVSLPYVARIDCRVVINEKTSSDLRQQYLKYNYDQELAERILLIENAVQIPGYLDKKKRKKNIRALYVGRGSVEKRVHLVAKIAKRCHEEKIAISFTVVGDVSGAVPGDCSQYCTLLGEVNDSQRLKQLYSESDLLLLTSSKEGFPMVIMDAMANGVVPVSTDVGGISSHITDNVNGYLIPGLGCESHIVDCFVSVLRLIGDNPERLGEMAEICYNRARESFNFERFNRSYRKLLVNSEGSS